jgi:hypothetical protein
MARATACIGNRPFVSLGGGCFQLYPTVRGRAASSSGRAPAAPTVKQYGSRWSTLLKLIARGSCTVVPVPARARYHL